MTRVRHRAREYLSALFWVILAIAVGALFRRVTPEPVVGRILYVVVLVAAVWLVTAKVHAPGWVGAMGVISAATLLAIRLDHPENEPPLAGCASVESRDIQHQRALDIPMGVVSSAGAPDTVVAWVLAALAREVWRSVSDTGDITPLLPDLARRSDLLRARDPITMQNSVARLVRGRRTFRDYDHLLELRYCGIDGQCGSCDDMVAEFVLWDRAREVPLSP